MEVFHPKLRFPSYLVLRRLTVVPTYLISNFMGKKYIIILQMYTVIKFFHGLLTICMAECVIYIWALGCVNDESSAAKEPEMEKKIS